MRVLGFLYVGVASGVLLAGALRWLDLVGFFSMPVCIAVMAVSLVIEIVGAKGAARNAAAGTFGDARPRCRKGNRHNGVERNGRPRTAARALTPKRQTAIAKLDGVKIPSQTRCP